LPSQPSESTAQRQARDADQWIASERHREVVVSSGGIQLARCHSRLHVRDTPFGIDRDVFHRRKIDHHSTFAHRFSEHIVPAAANRNFEVRSTRIHNRRA
jgi:hypothetical protein